MKTADSIRVNDVVEFEAGSPVTVLEIEQNWSDEDDAAFHPMQRAAFGRSFIFSCTFFGGAVNTFYVRREKSPIDSRLAAR